jgi:hypothetical protein
MYITCCFVSGQETARSLTDVIMQVDYSSLNAVNFERLISYKAQTVSMEEGSLVATERTFSQFISLQPIASQPNVAEHR